VWPTLQSSNKKGLQVTSPGSLFCAVRSTSPVERGDNTNRKPQNGPGIKPVEIGPSLTCPICLQSVPFLVRDHNHYTGLIRGEICEHCNSWLGLLERHPESYYLRQRPGRRRWRRWVFDNAGRIRVHLESDTGEIYARKKKVSKQGRNAARDQRKPGQGPTTTPSGADESSANTCKHGHPKDAGPCLECESERRLTWAREIIHKVKNGWDSPLLPLFGHGVVPSGGAPSAAPGVPPNGPRNRPNNCSKEHRKCR
jgi:hypothetical protein